MSESQECCKIEATCGLHMKIEKMHKLHFLGNFHCILFSSLSVPGFTQAYEEEKKMSQDSVHKYKSTNFEFLEKY